MKTTLYTFITAAAVCGLASAAETANTTPIGYVHLGDVAGANDAPANSDTIISIPLAQSAVYAGATSSVDSGAGTLTVSGAPAWAVDVWTVVPHCMIVTSGAEEGLTGIISTNDADTLTVTVTVGDLANVVATDTIRIEPCWTLGTLLPVAGGAGIPLGTQLLTFDGATAGINLSADNVYTATPGGWFQTIGGSGASDSTIIHPGESFILRTGASPVADLVVTGEAPSRDHRATVVKLSPGGTGQDSRVSFFSPVGQTLATAGIPAAFGDQLLIFDNTTAVQNKSASQIMTFTPGGWFGTLGPLAGDQSSYEVGSGAGYILRQSTGVAAGNSDWTAEQDYIPSL